MFSPTGQPVGVFLLIVIFCFVAVVVLFDFAVCKRQFAMREDFIGF
jgi:hypothetical protein